MKVLYELKECGFKELEELNRKERKSASDWESIRNITSAMKNINKICDHEEGYSRSGEWEGRMRGSYDRESSERHYVRGHYSRDDGYSQRNGYSRSGMKEQVERMMNEAGSDKEREALRRCYESL